MERGSCRPSSPTIGRLRSEDESGVAAALSPTAEVSAPAVLNTPSAVDAADAAASAIALGASAESIDSSEDFLIWHVAIRR